MSIDWNGKLEAVHTDGRVKPVSLRGGAQPDHYGTYAIEHELEGRVYFLKDGSGQYGKEWTIRNTPTPDERAVAPELVERMRKLAEMVEGVKEQTVPSWFPAIWDEARAIVAALEPSDRTEAKRLADIWEIDAEAAYQILARGRQLERASRDVTPCTREQFEEACRV